MNGQKNMYDQFTADLQKEIVAIQENKKLDGLYKFIFFSFYLLPKKPSKFAKKTDNEKMLLCLKLMVANELMVLCFFIV